MQILERIMRILDTFTYNASQLSLNDLVEKTLLPKPTVFRIAEALCDQNILNKDEKSGRYRIGVKLFELGSLYIQTMELKHLAFAEMEVLHKKTGEAVHMGVLDRDEVISIEGFESIHPLQTRLWIGKRSPIYCTSIGKAIFAFLPEEKRKGITATLTLYQHTRNTITDIRKLEGELDRIRHERIAVDNEEHEEGIVCIGAPILDDRGYAIASISISGPAIRMTQGRLVEYRKYLLEAVDKISGKLPGVPD
jgi:DNA-binding IclR family transcriptional regulator